jgi:hypothetical protein
MFPNPMMSMPFMGYMSQQPTPEQTAQMQQLALQNQQLQLRQMKQMLEQYAQSIDASLEQVEEQLAKLEKGEAVDLPTQAQIQVQARALQQRVKAQVDRWDYFNDAYRFDRFNDRYIDLRSDPQNLAISGMGDFGRPVF